MTDPAPNYPFPHERLDAWRVASEARLTALQYTRSLPPGLGDEARQINKAAASVVRNICEGAGRFKAREKVQKFEIAAGESSEAAGAVQVLLAGGLGDARLGEQFVQLQRRTAAMVTGLVRRQRRSM